METGHAQPASYPLTYTPSSPTSFNWRLLCSVSSLAIQSAQTECRLAFGPFCSASWICFPFLVFLCTYCFSSPSICIALSSKNPLDLLLCENNLDSLWISISIRTIDKIIGYQNKSASNVLVDILPHAPSPNSIKVFPFKNKHVKLINAELLVYSRGTNLSVLGRHTLAKETTSWDFLHCVLMQRHS